MKNKRFMVKIFTDIGMTVCLLLLMPYSLFSGLHMNGLVW